MSGILVFDSGIGGLSVLREIRARLPNEHIHYLADLEAFPYGHWEETALVDHCVSLAAQAAINSDAKALVIACNTASTLVLPRLRDRLDIPVVGTVPAIKPAAALTQTGVISVLATPGTVKRDYTFDLIAKWAPNVAINLVGAASLAELAEDKLAGRAVAAETLKSEIAPCFVEKDRKRTDVIVLGCTHYPFLCEEIERYAHWPVQLVDPAPAIARRVAAVLPGRAVDHGPSVGERVRPGTLTFETTGSCSGFEETARKALGLSKINGLDSNARNAALQNKA